MAPNILTVFGSRQLGLRTGSLVDLDSAVRRFSREELVGRVVSILNVLSTGIAAHEVLDRSFVEIVPPPIAARVNAALEKQRNSTFFEEWQQLVLLKRALTVAPNSGELEFMTSAGEANFFDACRFASDVLEPNGDPFSRAAEDHDTWLKIAAGLMPRLWLVTPPALRASVARMDLMLEGSSAAEALKSRFPEAIGLTFEETKVLTRFLAVWSGRLKLQDILSNPSAIRLDPNTWLAETNIPKERFESFLRRTCRAVDSGLEEVSADSALSAVAFRDRPFLRFSDDSIAACSPTFVMEKLTADVFWWLKDINTEQAAAWQQQWGYVAEEYAIGILKRIAEISGCEFASRVSTPEGEIDAIMWRESGVAVFEVTTSSLRTAEESTTDWKVLRDGLIRAFVERKQKAEAVVQLVRDARLCATGGQPWGRGKRVYPVMVTADRRTRTPGVTPFLHEQLSSRLPVDVRPCVAKLAVWHFDDLEAVEGLVSARPEWQTGETRGPFTLLKLWDWRRKVPQAWWAFLQEHYPAVPPSPVMTAAYERWRQAIPESFDNGGEEPPGH